MKTQEKVIEKKVENKKETVKPSNSYRIYPITITEWANGDILSYTIQKSYKDKEGNWKCGESFTEGDLAIIAKILSKI